MIELKTVTLEQIGGGLVPELFEHELQRVLRNIDDVNTDAKKARKITVDLVFHPSGDRESAAVIVSVAAKLAPVKPIGTSIFLGREKGQMVAYARDPRQAEIGFQVEVGRKEHAE